MHLPVLLIIASVISVSASSNAVSTSEMSGLQSLYDSTNGSNWNWHGSTGHWNFSNNENPCLGEWQGIGCNTECTNNPNSVCYVKDLVLIGYNLSGTVPSQLSLISSLISLVLSNNQLIGRIPSQLG